MTDKQFDDKKRILIRMEALFLKTIKINSRSMVQIDKKARHFVIYEFSKFYIQVI